jgi:MraZ protein
MLRGNALAKIDVKGRLKVPAAFRAVLEPKFGNEYFVTSLRGESIRIYPMETWVEIEQRLAMASSMNPAVMKFKNAVNYYGQTATMDAQGRVLLHPLVRERAGAVDEVAVLGQQDFLEVWNHGRFETGLESNPLTDDDLETLAGLGI